MAPPEDLELAGDDEGPEAGALRLAGEDALLRGASDFV